MQIESQLELFEFGTEILPGITAVDEGSWHTPGHAVYSIARPASDSGGPSGPPQAFFLGDALDNEVIGVENPYLRSLFDDDRDGGPPGRTRSLDKMVDSGAIGVYGHVTFPSAVRIVRQGLFFRAVKLIPETTGGVTLACPVPVDAA